MLVALHLSGCRIVLVVPIDPTSASDATVVHSSDVLPVYALRFFLHVGKRRVALVAPRGIGSFSTGLLGLSLLLLFLDTRFDSQEVD